MWGCCSGGKLRHPQSSDQLGTSDSEKERAEVAGLAFFLLPLFLIFLLMASPRGLVSILQNGKPSLPSWQCLNVTEQMKGSKRQPHS